MGIFNSNHQQDHAQAEILPEQVKKKELQEKRDLRNAARQAPKGCRILDVYGTHVYIRSTIGATRKPATSLQRPITDE